MAYIDEVEDAQGVGMEPGELERWLGKEIDTAIEYTDGRLSTRRELATAYYRGAKFGGEEDGRSQFVMTTYRDTVQQAMPSLMRVFMGSEKVVEYVPREAEDAAMAEQATDYVNYVLTQDNPGYEVIRGAIRDSLGQLVGIVKAFYDESTEVETHQFSGMPFPAVLELQNDPENEVLALSADPSETFYDIEVRRRRPKNRICVEVLPPEEFLIDRTARSLESAVFVAHRCLKTVSELVAMGYPQDLVEKHTTKSSDLQSNRERTRRSRFEYADGDYDRDLVLYVEAYPYVDYDGDGIAELRKICCMGDQHEVVMNEPWNFRPFADFHIDPSPHSFLGYDLFDRTKDLQKVNSEIMRNMLDSLAQSIHPRVAAWEDQVNMDDLLNNETGGIVRTTQPPPQVLQPLAQPFVGRDAMPVMDLFEVIRESRTGISKQTSGLDADALQSMTASAVSAIEEGSKLTLEEMARNLAETGFRKLFKILLKLVIQHQDAPRMVRLRNEWVQVDPSLWDAQMDVSVNVGLGSGGDDRKLAVLAKTLEYQMTAMQNMGPSNPLVGIGQVRYTLGKMLELNGFKDTSRFFKPLPVDFDLPPSDEPTGEEMLLQAQREAIYAEMQIKQAELEQKWADMRLRDDRERDKAAAKFAIDAAGVGVDIEKLNIDKAREKLSASDA